MEKSWNSIPKFGWKPCLIDLTTPEKIEETLQSGIEVPDVTSINLKYTLTQQDEDWIQDLLSSESTRDASEPVDPWANNKVCTEDERKIPLSGRIIETQYRPTPPWECYSNSQPTDPLIPAGLISMTETRELPPWEMKKSMESMKTIIHNDEEYLVLDELRDG